MRRTADWKRYPFVLDPDDAQLTFPAAEGDQGAAANTYYVSGRLRGRQSGRTWAFLTVFTYNAIRHRLRTDFHTLALFDLDAGTYGTCSDFDLPRPLRLRRRYKLSVARGHLAVAFAGAAGTSRWTTRRAPDGALLPFAYHLDLHGRDAAGRAMHLDLDVDTLLPPMPVGGAAYRGTKTCIGQYGTHSYFQSALRFTGALAWGETREAVDGDCGWIDRQWAPRHLGVHNDWRSARYRHEWRQIHLDNGMALSAWLNVDRRRHDRPIPFTGVTLATADGRVLCTTEYTLERTAFARDPDAVRPARPLTRGARWMTDAYSLRVPAWELALTATPLVAAPAHRFPIEYWSGPTQVVGTLGEQSLTGFGFHERTLVFCRDFELVDALRATLRHLPPAALGPGSPAPLALADLAWELDAFLSHGGRAAARAFLHAHLRPHLTRLAEPARAHVLQLCADLDALL